MKIEKAVQEDIKEILSILDEAKGSDLSEEERKKQGFVQGKINEDLLLKFIKGLGVYIAKSFGEIAGVVLVSKGGVIKNGPAGELYKSVVDIFPRVNKEQIFLYGPAAIKRSYRGRGILTLLLTHICLTLENDFVLGAAFVEKNNEKSLQIHRHYPMNESGSFIFDEKVYQIFTFNPSEVISFYNTKNNRE
ncbi:hypothetical protein [Apibacter sp. HY039]|uniref:hypothetical protein n=1 Tax=Apibacter sp. HY039 TaxID=2501476 RepID=UPI000FEB81B4|nr:hypothetical protein [Apibacter sp. HY039]